MYATHFGFSEDPFGATPDPRFLYFSAEHAEALAALHYGLLERRGFLVLIARPGMGKTTLLHHLLERWKDKADTAFLFRPPESRDQMINDVLQDLGMAPGPSYAASCGRLQDRAVECRERGLRLLLVFDEAQNIPREVLEQIRLLSNWESPEEKLIEVILAGQPGLADRLARPELEQLGQRVGIWTEIHELDPAEVRRYVEHRLRISGHRRGRILTRRALSLLAATSGGVPRNINSIGFAAFSTAFAEGRRRIDDRDIRRAARAPLLKATDPGKPWFRWTIGLAVAAKKGATREP